MLWVILAPISMIGEVAMDLFQPKLMSKIVDDGVIGGNFGIIARTGIIMLVTVIIGGLCGVLCSAFSGAAAQSFSCDLRNDTFKKVMSFSPSQSDKFTSGSLITRLTGDITAVGHFVEIILRMFIRMLTFFVGGIIMMLTLDISFGIVLVIALPAMLIAMVIALAKALPIYSRVQTKLDKVNNVLKENIAGVRVVRAFVREDYESERFNEANTDLSDTNLSVLLIMAKLNPILSIIMNTAVAIIIYVGGFQVELNSLNVGDVMAAVTYVTQIMMSVMMVSMMFQSVSRARVSANRINEVLETKAEICDGDNDKAALVRRGEICFKGVNFSYPESSGQPVLSGIALNIGARQTIGILGKTGSGKSTLINLITRYYDVTEGEITVDAIPVKDYNVHDLREKFGIVLQKSELFSGTVKQNIAWGNPNISDEDIIRAAKIAQADEFISAMPNGYDSIIAQKGISLSGGQKQRLCIARAIAKNPLILILDDCTSALDLATEARLQNALKNEMTNTTVIKIAQRVQSVKECDKIAVIDKGIISAIGTHDELMINSQIYRDIYDSQHGAGKKGNSDNIVFHVDDISKEGDLNGK